MRIDLLARRLLMTVVVFGVTMPCLELAGQTNRPATTPGRSTAAASKAAPEAERKARPLPYRGKLAKLDVQAKSLTVGTRTFRVSAGTRIEKEGRKAALADGVPGQMVTGSYRKLPDGTLEAVSVYFGGRGENAAEKKSGPTP